ncbi:hypothetical protein LguiB_036385 [Lonicera macranthoides]
MSFDSSRSANSDSKSKRSLNSTSLNSSGNSNKKKKTNQKTLGMAWGSNSRSSSRSSFRSSPFSDFGSYMAVKNRKLHDQFEAEASTSSHGGSSSEKPIFHGVSIFVDGYTIPSSQELRGYMLKHGGRFENYFSRRRVTHIICSNLPDRLPYQLEQLASETRHQPKLSAFFTPRGGSVSDDEATCMTDQSVSKIKDPSLEGGRTMDTKLSEEGESTENPKHYSDEFDDSVPYNSAGAILEELSCGNIVKQSVVAMVDGSVGVQLESCPSSPCAAVSSYCVDNEKNVEDKKTKQSSSSTVFGTSNQRHSTLVDPNFVENYFKVRRVIYSKKTFKTRYCIDNYLLQRLAKGGYK